MISKNARYHRHCSLRPRAGQRPKSAFRQLTIQPVWRSYTSSPRPKPRPFLPTTETAGCVGLAGNLRRVALLAASVLGGAAAVWSLAARVQQATVGFFRRNARERGVHAGDEGPALSNYAAAFLDETGELNLLEPCLPDE